VVDKNIKIPAKHYVGMVKRQTEKIPLGFITPWGEDAAAKKRIATVDSWAKQGHYGNKQLPAMTIDNVPMAGFKMTTDIRSSSYGGVDKWRIEDPRGFELEITSHNLAQLLSVGMIDRGEIMDTCVWARSGQNNVLLSTNTEEYKAAVKNTEVAAMTADWKDVKIGNTVLLQNNISGVWLGRMYGMSIDGYHRDDKKRAENSLAVSDKSMHVIYIDKPDAHYKHTLMLINSPKLAAITDTSVITDSEAETVANQYLNDNTCNTQTAGYKDFIALTIGAPKIGVNATLSLKEIPIADESVLENATYYKSRYYVYQETGQYLYRIVSSKDYRTNRPQFTANAYDKKAFEEHRIVPVGGITREGGSGYWGRQYEVWRQKSFEYVFSNNDKFYAVVVNIATKAGSTIEAYVK
jgi:hypothetical protein